MQLHSQQIKQLRSERGWTQQQLADICSLSLRTIQRVELIGVASLETTKALAVAFECDRAALLAATDLSVNNSQTAMPLYVLIVTFIAGVLSGALLLSLFRAA